MKYIFPLLAITILVFVTGCKKDKSKENQPVEKVALKNFVLKPDSTKVSFVAYKTTEKKPVGGVFNVVNFEIKSGNNVVEVLNNVNFSIPVSSLFTKDESRDGKLKEFFFGIMENTELLSGTLKCLNDSTCVASLTMNNATKDLPLTLKIEGERKVTLNGIIQLSNWNATEALESLNKACLDLHKGADGVSKTWDEVAVEITTYLDKK